ncbi:MAG: helix-turn-helix domain-containing protein [Leptospiraceae bacterium]|nr:helix-turn-helix domain-containing protein [Leptospiraceae bacterium]MCP5502645.1 helix-turn-helix domain-containing protein [Leptospiraceae bacterium]
MRYLKNANIILKLFLENPDRHFTLSEIAVKADIHYLTVRRMLITFEEDGILSNNGKAYKLSQTLLKQCYDYFKLNQKFYMEM